MDGTASRGFGIWGSTLESSSSSKRCEYGELVAETTCSEQLEDETSLTSEDDESGRKPSDLYGKFTWKICKFSQLNKREVRSSTFEVGSYKWYILIYPQGCDVCHHISLFLCVADHDKLLPGWSHSALFTIFVDSKDPKKSKYSDTLHRFWKKEHDWGWKKFMELPKVLDGFFENDTLIIKVQVQVIREKANCPFRSLDRQYKRELARVYLTPVEQIFRRFLDEKREKLLKFIENKARWTSFCSFWKQIDESTRKWMSSENKEIILRRVVKQFFVENEVTSILVMDSLFFGLKTLMGQYGCSKGTRSLVLCDEAQPPIARVESEVFVLADDVVPIVERVVRKPLHLEDKKGPQQLRTKDGGDDSCKSMDEQNERRLAELGQLTLEIYVLGHIFSNRVEIAYQEAVSLQMQDDLIREEAEYEKLRQRSSGNEKKSKKKQAKQKKSNKKEKEKKRDTKHVKTMAINADTAVDMEDCAANVVLPTLEQCDASEDVSDLEDVSHSSNNDSTVTLSGLVPIFRGTDGKRSSVIDDSSSTCSTDSISSAILNTSAASFPQSKTTSVPRKNDQQHNGTADDNRANGLKGSKLTGPGSDKRHQNNGSVSSKVGTKEAYEQAQSCQNDGTLSNQQLDVKDVPSREKTKTVEKSTAAPLCHVGPLECSPASRITESPSQTNGGRKPYLKLDRCLCTDVPVIQPIPLMPMPTPMGNAVQKPEAKQVISQNRTERTSNPQVCLLPKPATPPVVASSYPATLLIPVSVAGQIGPVTQSLSVRNCAPQSYKSAVMQNAEGSRPRPRSSVTPPPTASPSTAFCTNNSDKVVSNYVSSELFRSKSASGALNFNDQWMTMDPSPSRPMGFAPPSLDTDKQQLSLSSYWHSRSVENMNGSGEFVRAGCQTQADEFPHLDLINYLLDEELNTQNASFDPASANFHHMPVGYFPVAGEFAEPNNSFRSQENGLYHYNGFQIGDNSQFSLVNDMMLPGGTVNFMLDSPGMLSQTPYNLPSVHPNSSVSSDIYQMYRQHEN